MNKRPEPTETDYARLAAYIDGEGNVEICGRADVRRYYAQVVVTNTDPRLVLWIYNTFGGFLRAEHRNNDKNPLWRGTMVWYVTCKRAHDILLRCRPYLVSKGEQADILFAFRATVGRVGVKGHSEATMLIRAQMREQLKALRRVKYPRVYLESLALKSKQKGQVIQ